jgi:hypothetical protein
VISGPTILQAFKKGTGGLRTLFQEVVQRGLARRGGTEHPVQPCIDAGPGRRSKVLPALKRKGRGSHIAVDWKR